MTLLKALMQLKDINIKTLVTGDKSARITLETIYPEDVKQLKEIAEETEVIVSISKETP